MTKSIEEVLEQSLLQAVEDGGNTVNGLVTIRLEALKEIEAIMSAAKPSSNRISQITSNNYTSHVGSEIADEYETNLQAALYGKED